MKAIVEPREIKYDRKGNVLKNCLKAKVLENKK